MNGVRFCSSMFPGRAPDGYVALSAYLSGVRAPDLAGRPEAELSALVTSELRDIVGARGVRCHFDGRIERIAPADGTPCHQRIQGKIERRDQTLRPRFFAFRFVYINSHARYLVVIRG